MLDINYIPIKLEKEENKFLLSQQSWGEAVKVLWSREENPELLTVS